MESENPFAYKYVSKHGGVSQYFKQGDILAELNKERGLRPEGCDDGRCEEIRQAYLLGEIGRLEGGFEFDHGPSNKEKRVQQNQKIFRKIAKRNKNWFMPRKGFLRVEIKEFNTLLDAVKAIGADERVQVFEIGLRIMDAKDKDGNPIGHADLNATYIQEVYSQELTRLALKLGVLRLVLEGESNPLVIDLHSCVNVAWQGLLQVKNQYPEKLDSLAEVKQRFERLLTFTQQLTIELEPAKYSKLCHRLEQVVRLLDSIMDSTITQQDQHQSTNSLMK